MRNFLSIKPYWIWENKENIWRSASSLACWILFCGSPCPQTLRWLLHKYFTFAKEVKIIWVCVFQEGPNKLPPQLSLEIPGKIRCSCPRHFWLGMTELTDSMVFPFPIAGPTSAATAPSLSRSHRSWGTTSLRTPVTGLSSVATAAGPLLVLQHSTTTSGHTLGKSPSSKYLKPAAFACCN